MINGHFKVAGLATVFLGLAVSFASAQSNVALVIGNAAYQSGKPLPTTIADASLVAETMRGAGYDVTELRDVQQRDHGQILNNFLNKIAGAGSNGTVFFYYAVMPRSSAETTIWSQSMLQSRRRMTFAPRRCGWANCSRSWPRFRRPHVLSCWMLPTSTALAEEPLRQCCPVSPSCRRRPEWQSHPLRLREKSQRRKPGPIRARS
ncbi:MAG: hypothetical protein QOG73_401 [Acetobacteraceae bacterium]|nr:hypothetical protein [Acetobacteraceae bacterium]